MSVELGNSELDIDACQVELGNSEFDIDACQVELGNSEFDLDACQVELGTSQLDTQNFDQLTLKEPLRSRNFSQAASKHATLTKRPLARQLRRHQLEENLAENSLEKALDSNSFKDSNLTEETFSKAPSKKAAWKKRPSEGQLQRQQLGRGDFQQGSFHDSSLDDETFSKAASKKTAWKRHFALATSQRAASQLSFEQPSFQRRTSTTELSELERTALHTELAEFERPALTTEFAQLEARRFDENNFELSKASLLLGSGRLETNSRRGGVLRDSLPSLTFTSLSLMPFLAQASPTCFALRKGACSLSA